MYQEDSNVAAHSVDSDMFNAVIHLSAKVKTAYEPEGGARGAAAPPPPPPQLRK